jgi:hypothetical protein
MKEIRVKELKVNDIFRVEYGCYGNYTEAVVKGIKDTNYDHIKEVEYTIPKYTKEEIHTMRMIIHNTIEIEE